MSPEGATVSPALKSAVVLLLESRSRNSPQPGPTGAVKVAEREKTRAFSHYESTAEPVSAGIGVKADPTSTNKPQMQGVSSFHV